MSYSTQQKQILSYTQTKARDFMLSAPVPGHGFDHVMRVTQWAKKIAVGEHANLFLCEMAGLLHDVGRVWEEKYPQKTHHEASYEICQQWFREDGVLKKLSKQEKLILLYSVRYHWNNTADKYVEAIILRDADKLDLFGKIGLKRNAEYLRHDEKKIMMHMRYRVDDMFWLRTKVARGFFKKYNMFEPVYKYTAQRLKKQIKPVSL